MALQPANAADVRSIVEQRLAALSSSLEARQTATIEWRGRQTYVDVIDMPVDLLAYNPDTHRIRAQKTLDPAREHALDTDPYGKAAQDYLHYLLKGDSEDPSKEDPAFSALKESLAEHGQEEPGIITRSGVLVNGNTRCAALRELNRDHVRVGVLPEDAGDDDVRTIELALQLRREHKRDYSFVNFLLAIDERVALGRPDQEILSNFRLRQASLDRAQWILAFIREAIERSRSEDQEGNVTQLRLVDFESHRGKLEELHRAYSALKSKNPDEAEALREQRMLALVLDKSKTDLRLVDPGFAEKYMSSYIPVVSTDSTARTIPGTSIQRKEAPSSVQRLRALTNEILQAKAVLASSGSVPSWRSASASQRIQDIDEAMDGALEKAGKTARILKRTVAPSDRITDAIEDLNLATQAIAEARAGSTFSAEDVEDALASLNGAVVKLAQQVSLSRGQAQGEGVDWLLRAAAAQGDN